MDWRNHMRNKAIARRGSVLLTLLCIGLRCPSAGATAPGVRLAWQEFATSPSRVASLMKGISVMKGRNTAPHDSAEYRTSWEYWAAMHAYYSAAPGWPWGSVA